MDKALYYNTTAGTYQVDTMVRPSPGCNGYIAINRGDGVVFVNNVPLNPSALGAGNNGDSYAVSGNTGEIFGGAGVVIELRFAPGTANPSLVLVQKYYISAL